MTDREAPPDAILLGSIGRSYGLRGEVRFRPRAPRAAALLAELEEVHVEGLGLCRVESVRAHGNDWLLSLARVRDVTRARRLAHARVWAAAAALPPEARGDPALSDPTGRPVLRDGAPWGEVAGVEGTPAQPVLRVRGPAGERLLPLAAPYVRVDEEAVHVTDAPPGLLEDEA